MHETSTATLQPDRARSYRAAARHSRKVAVMKRLLPIVAALALVGTGAFLLLGRAGSEGVTVDLASTAITDGKLVMTNPKVNGKTPDGRDYSVTASRAIQPIDGTEVIDLEQLAAQFIMEDGSRANLASPAGTLDRAQNLLALSGPSTFETANGVQVAFTRADINIDSGSFSTDQPVTVEQPGTRIQAQSMHILENGASVVFEGAVRVVLTGETAAGVQRLSMPSPTPTAQGANRADSGQQETGQQ